MNNNVAEIHIWLIDNILLVVGIVFWIATGLIALIRYVKALVSPFSG